MDKAPKFLFGQELPLKKNYLIIYHYDGEDVDTLKVNAKSAEHAIHIANATLKLQAEKEHASHEYYLDLLIDPKTCEILERL